MQRAQPRLDVGLISRKLIRDLAELLGDHPTNGATSANGQQHHQNRSRNPSKADTLQDSHHRRQNKGEEQRQSKRNQHDPREIQRGDCRDSDNHREQME